MKIHMIPNWRRAWRMFSVQAQALALAILGWPVEKLPPDLARTVLEGARSICAEANIPLAGGHSIDSLEPLFGLAVNGIAARAPCPRLATTAPATHGRATTTMTMAVANTPH